MALRNVHAIANRYISGAVNPNFLGSWLSSAGYVQPGDASFTGAIAGTVLTVSALVSGALAVGALLNDTTLALAAATRVVNQLSGVIPGGAGTYTIDPPQNVSAEPMTSNGSGARTPGFQTFSGIPMQVQAMSAEELQHVDGLNLQQTNRAVYMNGQSQGAQRPDAKGGDILQIPTGLTGAAFDTWLVKAVLEGWDAGGWCKVAVVLQMAVQDQ